MRVSSEEQNLSNFYVSKFCVIYRYELRSDVRASLYDYVNTFVKGLKGKDFMGGSDPNLADLVRQITVNLLLFTRF